MNTSEITGLVGLAVLLVNAGVQWGLQLAARSQNEKDHERIERDLGKCRDDWKAEVARDHSGGSDRLSRVDDDVNGLGVKIDRGFAEVQSAIGALSNKLVEHEVRLKNVEARVGSMRAMGAVRDDTRRDG